MSISSTAIRTCTSTVARGGLACTSGVYTIGRRAKSTRGPASCDEIESGGRLQGSIYLTIRPGCLRQGHRSTSEQGKIRSAGHPVLWDYGRSECGPRAARRHSRSGHSGLLPRLLQRALRQSQTPHLRGGQIKRPALLLVGRARLEPPEDPGEPRFSSASKAVVPEPGQDTEGGTMALVDTEADGRLIRCSRIAAAHRASTRQPRVNETRRLAARQGTVYLGGMEGRSPGS